MPMHYLKKADYNSQTKEKEYKNMDNKLYGKILAMVEELQIKTYHKTLLATMIYRKVKHPLERTDEILQKVTEKVIPMMYESKRGKTWMRVSTARELEALEEALHECKNLPNEDLTRGYIVSNVVKYYAKKMMED